MPGDWHGPFPRLGYRCRAGPLPRSAAMTARLAEAARLPLADTLILEAVDDAAPAALAQAAGMCGRVAADLGARVLRVDAAPEPNRTPTDLFLHAGKERVPVAPATA